jgi:hypothetical protein
VTDCKATMTTPAMPGCIRNVIAGCDAPRGDGGVLNTVNYELTIYATDFQGIASVSVSDFGGGCMFTYSLEGTR